MCVQLIFHHEDCNRSLFDLCESGLELNWLGGIATPQKTEELGKGKRKSRSTAKKLNNNTLSNNLKKPASRKRKIKEERKASENLPTPNKITSPKKPEVVDIMILK